MPLAADADVALLLSRLRPGADWGWSGGDQNDPSNVVWRDTVQVEPTQAEYASEWPNAKADVDTKAATRSAARGGVTALAGKQFEALTLAELTALVKVMAFQRGGVADDGSVRPIENWRGGGG